MVSKNHHLSYTTLKVLWYVINSEESGTGKHLDPKGIFPHSPIINEPDVCFLLLVSPLHYYLIDLWDLRC